MKHYRKSNKKANIKNAKIKLKKNTEYKYKKKNNKKTK